MRIDRTLALGALVAGAAALVVALALVFVQGGFGPTPGYFLIAGAALLIAGAVLEPSAVLALGRTRRGRSGAFSVGMSILVLGALAFANVWASKGFQHVDLTGSQVHTLAPKSLAVLRQLQGDVQVTSFYLPADRSQVSDLLGLYQGASSRVKVEYADPNSDVAEAKALGVESPDSLVLRYQDRKPVVLGPGSNQEQDITGAILKLELNRSLSICWVVGEGERDLQSSDQTNGYSQAGGALAGDGFTPRALDLSLAASVPSGCDVVAVVGPRKALSDQAVKALTDYAAAGGRLLLAAEPWQPDVTASLNKVAAPAGITIDDGVVIDDSDHRLRDHPAYTLVFQYGQSVITKDLGNTVSVFPTGSGITESSSLTSTVSPLATSSAAAYAVPPGRQSLTRQSGDKGGPLDLMASAERTVAGGTERMVVVGSAGFAENDVLPPSLAVANLQLFLGSLDWLSGQDALIALPPKPTGPQPLTVSAAQAGFDLFVTLFLMPLLIAFGGFLVWLRRRRTGMAPPTGPGTAPAGSPPPPPATPD